MESYLKGLGALALSGALGIAANSAQAQVVISQLYGNGGGTSAVYTRDYVELFNQSYDDVDISTWSLQYASATGATWTRVNFTTGTSVKGRSYFLVALQSAGPTGIALPAGSQAVGDFASTSFNMSSTQGKVALVSNQTSLSGAAPTLASPIVDFIGYGATASQSEGGLDAPAATNTLGLFRAASGCTDANNNSTDFATGAPSPRTSLSNTMICTDTTAPAPSSPISGTTYGSLATVTVTFPEPVRNVLEGSFTLNGSPATAVAYELPFVNGANTGYRRFIFSGFTEPTISGAHSMVLNETGVIDMAGNAMAAAYSATLNLNNVRPAVTLTSVDVISGGTALGAVDFVANFSEDVTGFAVGDITVPTGTVSAFTTVTPSQYTFTVTPNTASLLTVTIAASAATAVAVPNNPSLAGTFSWTNDPIGPREINTTSITSPRQTAVNAVSFEFDEPLVGFTAADIIFQRGFITQNAGTVPFSLSNSNKTVDVDLTGLAVVDGLYSLQVGHPGGAATDALGNAINRPGLVSWIKDTVAPTAGITAPGDTTLVGTTTTLTLQTVNFVNGINLGNTPLASRSLKVVLPGQTSETVLGSPNSGAYAYTFPTSGRYLFSYTATDTAGNTTPANYLALYVNLVENGSFTQTLANSGDPLIFPQTATEDVSLALTGGTPGGTVTVTREQGSVPIPSGFVDALLVDERLVITSSGLGTFSADLTWQVNPANVGAVTVERLFKFNGGSLSASYAVAPGAVIAPAVTSFSEWYVGEDEATSVDEWTLLAD
jgi:hypothetical protein